MARDLKITKQNNMIKRVMRLYWEDHLKVSYHPAKYESHGTVLV